jgi:hypothetical protein
MVKFGLIGCGNMGGALAKAAAQVLPKEELLLANRTPAKALALAEMLGGSLAQLDKKLVRKAVMRQLHSVRKLRIALGGYHKYSHWYWLNGKEIKLDLPPDRYDRQVSLNECFAAVRNGKLCNAVEFDAFLMEIPKK